MPALPPPRLPLVAAVLCAATLAAAAPKPAPRKPAPKPTAAKPAVKPGARKPPAKPSPAAARQQPPNLGSRGVAPSVRPKPGLDRVGEPAATRLPPPAPAPRPPAALWVTTDLRYDPRGDWKADLLALGAPGAAPEEAAQALQVWRGTGIPIHRVLPALADVGGVFSAGQPDFLERDAVGKPVGAAERPEVTPTGAWVAHLKERLRASLAAGADGIWLDEPAPTAAGGRSPAFRAAWREAFGADWSDPHADPTAFFRGARLRADLGLYALNDLLRHTRELSREAAVKPAFYLATRAPTALAGEGRVFPLAGASRLPVDGIVGRLRVEDALRPLVSEGRPEVRPFESAWLMASYFGNLVEALPDKALVLAPEATGAAGALTPGYQRTLPQLLAASLFAGPVRGYALPDPNGLLVPPAGSETSPGDADFLTVLSNLAAALKEVPTGEAPEWVASGTRGIGALTLDTLGYQQGGPRGSSLRPLYGLTLPLLNRGVPVQVVPAERVADPGFLTRYKVLLLSFEMQKPLGPELGQALAEWVKGGGTLLFFGSEDPYNAIGEWWNRNGLTSPADHLVRQFGAGVDPTQRLGREAAERYVEVLRAGAAAPAMETPGPVRLPLAGHVKEAAPVYLRFTDATPADGEGLRVGRVRVLEGERVRADFVAGGPGERAFLVEEAGTTTSAGSRSADGEAGFVYRFARLGSDARLEVELTGDYRLSLATGEDPAAHLRPQIPTLAPVRVPSRHALATYLPNGAQPLYALSRPGAPDAALVWQAQHGQGAFVYCGVPASFGAESAAGAEFVRGLVRHACARALLAYQEGSLIIRRGPIVAAHALGRTATLPGVYLDLLHPEFPVVENPALPYREAALFKQLRVGGKAPGLVHASHRARVLEATPTRTRVVLEGPTGQWGVLRLFPAGMSLTGSAAVDAQGQAVPVDIRPEGRLLRFRYPQQAGGVTLTLTWIRPEARLTK